MSEQSVGSAGSPGSPGSPGESAVAQPVPVPVAGGRGRQVAMDMVRSLGLVAIVLGIWFWFSHPRTPDAIHTVEWYPTAQSATQATDYQVLAPPERFAWSATSARIEPQPDGTVVWRVGFYTPEDAYAGVLQRGVFPEQATGSLDDWVAEQTRHGTRSGTVTIGGREWVRMEGDPTPDEKRSLVSVGEGTVTIVTGSAEWSELEQLAGALRPMPADGTPAGDPRAGEPQG